MVLRGFRLTDHISAVSMSKFEMGDPLLPSWALQMRISPPYWICYLEFYNSVSNLILLVIISSVIQNFYQIGYTESRAHNKCKGPALPYVVLRNPPNVFRFPKIFPNRKVSVSERRLVHNVNYFIFVTVDAFHGIPDFRKNTLFCKNHFVKFYE